MLIYFISLFFLFLVGTYSVITSVERKLYIYKKKSFVETVATVWSIGSNKKIQMTIGLQKKKHNRLKSLEFEIIDYPIALTAIAPRRAPSSDEIQQPAAIGC